MLRPAFPFRRRILPLLVAALAGSAAAAPELRGQDEPPLGFGNVAELTFVMTSGNATSSTLGLKDTATYRFPTGAFELSFGAVRAESGITTRVATGTPEDFTIVEETETETTAENYFARARLDRTLGGAAFVFGGAGWERNTFAGIENRYAFVAGVGRTWFESEERRLKTDLGATFTVQEDVVEAAGADDSFLGARATLDYLRALTATTSYSSTLVVDESFDETDDLRADWTNAIAVTMSERLALKASYRILFDNLPALVSVPLGEDDTVQVPLEKVDGTLGIALVVDL
jgi:putative salt-induced outer membrane protein YdiY